MNATTFQFIILIMTSQIKELFTDDVENRLGLVVLLSFLVIILIALH